MESKVFKRAKRIRENKEGLHVTVAQIGRTDKRRVDNGIFRTARK